MFALYIHAVRTSSPGAVGDPISGGGSPNVVGWGKNANCAPALGNVAGNSDRAPVGTTTVPA